MVMADVKNNANTIDLMQREKFRDAVFAQIAKREDFSRLVCLGVDALTEDEKSDLRAAMVVDGVSLEPTGTDAGLTAVARSAVAPSGTAAFLWQIFFGLIFIFYDEGFNTG